MRAAEKTREGLRGSRDDVISFKNAQRSVATKRNILWHKKKIVRANESLRIQKQVTDMKIMLDEAALEFKEESDAVDLMATTIKTLKKEHVKLEKETDDWREKYAQFERKDVKMREDLIHSKAEKKKLSKITKKSVVVVQACKEQIQALMEDEPSRNEDVGKSKLTKIKTKPNIYITKRKQRDRMFCTEVSLTFFFLCLDFDCCFQFSKK